MPQGNKSPLDKPATKGDLLKLAGFLAFNIRLDREYLRIRFNLLEARILKAIADSGVSAETLAKATALVAKLKSVDADIDKSLAQGTPPTSP